MSRLVELGGWLPELPFAELESVAPNSVVERRGHIVLIGPPAPAELRRLGFARRVLAFVGETHSLGDASSIDWGRHVQGTYAVRVHDENEVMGSATRRALIDAVWHAIPAPKVDLAQPETELHAYVTREGVWWGALDYYFDPAVFRARLPQRRPFFRSIVVPPRKARCLVNLTGVRPGQRLLDPFCGTGSLLIEGALMGCEVVGSDIDRVMVSGAQANLAYEGVSGLVHQADARTLASSGIEVDAIVTDLPYGHSASLKGVALPDLVAEFLCQARGVLRPGGRAVVMSPAGVLPLSPGFTRLATFSERVHASLTREVVVLERR